MHYFIAMAKVNNVPKCASYRDGNALKEPVENLLKASGVDLSSGGGLENFDSFSRLQNNCLTVYTQIWLCLAEISFWRRNCTSYIIGTRHYNEINNLRLFNG